MDESTTAIMKEIAQGETFVRLILKKNELLRSILEIDEQLAALHKNVVAGVTAPQDNAPAPARSKRGRKPKGDLSVAGLILQVLGTHPEGLAMSDIAIKLREHGFSFEGVDGSRLVTSNLSSLKSRGRISKDDNGKFVLVRHEEGADS